MVDSKLVSISDIAYVLGMDSARLLRWYKDVLSGYKQKKESGELRKYDISTSVREPKIRVPILKVENLGKRIGIDDKCIDGKYHTILYNLETSDIIMIIKSTKSEEIYKVLRTYLTVEQRFGVEVITKDCAGNYDWVARQAFPNAIRVADKFHIMMFLFSTLQQVRIEYKNAYIIEQEKRQQLEWSRYQAALKKSNKKERSISKKSYIAREEKLLNGDTIKQLLTRSKYLLYKAEEEWSEEQKNRAAILFEKFTEIKKLYDHIQNFRKWYSLENFLKSDYILATYFDNWCRKLKEINSQATKALQITLKNQRGVILNYFKTGDTNAVAESVNRKIEKLIGKSYGIRDLDFFYFRLNIYMT